MLQTGKVQLRTLLFFFFLYLIYLLINFRVKDVDWIPYLTTRLVDDAASHMRLYRQARARLKQVKGHQTSKVSSSSSTSGGTPKRTPTHRRNKSETDVFWYSQSKFYIPNLTALNEPKAEIKNEKETETLEKIFFDLEVQMEKNLICRDLVCTDEAKELAFLEEISEVLLFLLLPKADFDCLTVRFILRELLVNVIIKPLLDLFSDPDYINQTFIWLVKNFFFSTTIVKFFFSPNMFDIFFLVHKRSYFAK